MKRALIFMLLFVASLISAQFIDGVIKSIHAQQGYQGAGQLIFVCGQSSQQVMEMMTPLVPIVKRDTYGFTYLTYNVNGVQVLLQFFNDRLQGVGLGKPTPPPPPVKASPVEPRMYEQQIPEQQRAPYRAPKGIK